MKVADNSIFERRPGFDAQVSVQLRKLPEGHEDFTGSSDW